MSAIVGKNGTRWNAKATIDFDEPEHVKQLAYILLEQRNDMYAEIEQDIEWLQRLSAGYVIGSYELRSVNLRIKTKKQLLAKAKGES